MKIVKHLNIPPDIDLIEVDNKVYYNLKQIMGFLGLTYYGYSRMESYNLRTIVNNDYALPGPKPVYVLEEDIQNIILRHRVLVDKFVIKG